MDRNEPKPRSEPHVSEHLERPTFVVQQTFRNPQQHADNTVLTARAADGAVVTVDGDRTRIRAHIGALVVCHSAVLLLGVARTVSRGTDN